MFDVQFDFSEMAAASVRFGATADQIPYALARSLNDAAEEARSFLIGTTWPTHVTARNPSFIKAALTTQGKRATKEKLEVEVYDRLNRASINLHAKGGLKIAKSGNLAIGTRNVTRGARGVPSGQKPRAGGMFKKGDVIYQRQMGGKGKKKKANGKLKLMYVLSPQARIKKDVPMYRDFETVMKRALPAAIAKNVAIAMRTRR